MIATVLIGAGCAQVPGALPSGDAQTYRQRGFECLKRGIQYPYLPSVRVQSVEAMQRAAPAEEGLPWIRIALTDEHPAVRFAACMAVGALKDGLSREGVAKLLQDGDPRVRVGAIFAVHRLGDVRHTAELAEYLLDNHDASVRRNAALVLGRLGEPGAISLLAKAMRDKDEGVQLEALEAMSLLGSADARQTLAFQANSGVGFKEVFAINALAETRDPRYADTFRFKLRRSEFRETRLAAARGLGVLRKHDGFNEALAALGPMATHAGGEDDPPENQLRRMRQLAALALGAIGDPAALPELDRLTHSADDPNVQVAAGTAMLEIVNRVTKVDLAQRPSAEPRKR